MKAIDVLRGLLKDTIEPMLLQDGFVRLPKGQSHVWVLADYNRPGDGLIHCANVQREGKWWQVDKGEFRIGFGILVPTWNEMQGRPTGGQTEGWCDLLLRRSIPWRDQWLMLSANSSSEAVKKQIAADFADHVRPWLAERSTPAGLRDCLEREGLHSAATIANLALKDISRARRFLKLAVEHRNEQIISIALKHGATTEAEHKKLQWAVIQDVDTLKQTVDEVFGPSA